MNDRPSFVNALSHAYSRRRKSVVVLTGATLDLFWSPAAERFLPLEQTLYRELSEKILMMRLDAAQGITFYDPQDRATLVEMMAEADTLVLNKDEKLGNIEARFAEIQHQPLQALVLLAHMLDASTRLSGARDRTKGVPQSSKSLCVVIQYGASLFPAGEFDRLNELDRQRLVTFLNMVTNPTFVNGESLIILVSDTRAEINSRILALPHAEAVEIRLPDRGERQQFVDQFCKTHSAISFEGDRFVDDAAGLKLTGIEDILEVAARTGEQISRRHVLEEVNARIRAEMGSIVQIVRPEHSPDDIIGYEATNAVLREILEDCDDPATAVSAIIVSGPNGGGKTFQLEAYAPVSGRVVIRLAEIRSQWYGGTDILIEKLRLLIETYGKIMIMMDEAHTQFGSVHKSDTHETEKRLSGAIISMMSDPRFLGKVLWVLMTSRPDSLDPDVKSRAPEQIPIFDLEGDERKRYIKELFRRKGIDLEGRDLDEVAEATAHFSNRDFRDFLKKYLGKRRRVPELRPIELLGTWKATTAIVDQRRMQTLIALEHCSYPDLVPPSLRDLSEGARRDELEKLRFLHRT